MARLAAAVWVRLGYAVTVPGRYPVSGGMLKNPQAIYNDLSSTIDNDL